MRRWLIRFWAFTGGALVLAFLGGALFGGDGVTRHEKLRKELDRINRLNSELSRSNRRLAVEAKALRHDPAYIEQVIRDELGWVKGDELVFIFPEGGGS